MPWKGPKGLQNDSEQVPRNTDKVSSVEWSRVHYQANSNLEAMFD